MQSSGAQNNDSFRQFITTSQLSKQNQNYQEKPQKLSFNSQGIFNEYYFDTGLNETKEIFEVNYNFARIEHPITKKEELFIGFGINCRDDGKNLRNNLNLMLLLDVSGSMNQEIPLTDEVKYEYQQQNAIKKIDLAKDVLITLVQSLKKEDNLGIILFNNKSSIFQELVNKSQIKESLLLKNIQKIQAFSGTDMESSLQITQTVFDKFKLSDQSAWKKNDTRIIFITDAQPNCGNNQNSLIQLTQNFADQNIFITYIGVGLDFNVQLTEQLTKIRGCNFFSVHSGSQFKSLLVENFNYIMTPQVFDAKIEFESQFFEIEETYGTNFRDQNQKQLFKIETIMAGNKINNEIKGGLILAKIKKNQKIVDINDANQVFIISFFLFVCFKDKFCIIYEIASTKEKIKKSDTFNLSQLFVEQPINSYTNLGIRKAVFLAIYSDYLTINLKDLTKINAKELNLLIEYLEMECASMNTKDLYKEIEILQRLKSQIK